MSSAALRKIRVSSAWPYAIASGAVGVAALIRYGLNLQFGSANPFILFWPLIVVAAIWEGFWLGLFTTAAASALVWYLILPPARTFSVSNTLDIIGLVLFVVIGSIMSSAGDLFRRKTLRLQEFQKAVEGVQEMIVVVDRDYRYLIANDTFLKYRGLKRDEVIGRRIASGGSLDAFESSLKQKLGECLSGTAVEHEMTHTFPERGERELHFNYFPIEGANGIDRVACIAQDVTERSRWERSLAASEQRYRQLFQTSPAGVAISEIGGRIVDCNDAWARILGYESAEEIRGRSPADFYVNLSDRAPVLEELNREGALCSREMQLRRKDGTPVWVLFNAVLLSHDSGPQFAQSTVIDISKRKLAEDALRTAKEFSENLIKNANAMILGLDPDGNVNLFNDAGAAITGYTFAELKGKSWSLLTPRDRFPYVWAEFEKLVEGTGSDTFENPIITKTGEERLISWRNSTVKAEGNVVATISFGNDVTEHKRAEESLRRREEDYRRFVAQSSEGIFREELDTPIAVDLPEEELIDHILHDSYMAECNDAMAKMYGFTSGQELVGRRLSEMLVANDKGNIEMTRDYIRSGFQVLDRESQEVDVQGSPKVFRNSLIGIIEDGNLVRTWGIQRDVTEQVHLEKARVQAEAALRKSEEHFRILVEQATDGIFVADENGRYLDVNSAGAQMLGYSREEILVLSIRDIVVENDKDRLPQEVSRFAGGSVICSEWTFRRKDGSFFPGEVSGKRLPDGRLQGILRDITERKRAQEEVHRNEERFRVALKDSPITVFNQDCDLRYTWIYNPQMYWQHESLGRTDEEIIGTRKSANLTSLKRRVLATGLPVREEVTVPGNGKRFAFDMSIEPLFDAQGRIIGITGACMDIGMLRELADRLQDSKDRLQEEKCYLEKEIRSELGFADIIGNSVALQEVLKKTRVVAGTDSTVLLLGETGTGKELVARSLHSLSGRHDKTFVKLNCAAVPSGLLESELFGHEKGAFTSASSQKLGRIELADKGTLFLDEIGELPLELQPKLLRVLQDREFERLGGIRTFRVDVRIISATNRDLRQDITEKRFREDLYYRLNVFPIQLPPLRDRREDIPSLVRHFVDKHAARMGKHVDIVLDETIRTLQDWKWPGNIRELENMIERMMILSKGRVLSAPPADLFALNDAVPDDLNEMERDHIIRVLRETNGILSGSEGAAVRLGLKRTTLQSMLKRLGIEADDFRRGHVAVGDY